MTKGKPTEEPVVCDICGQIVDEKPDRHDFGLVGNKLPLNGHPTCIKNVEDKIMGPNRTMVKNWIHRREGIIQRQIIEAVITRVQERVVGDLQNLSEEMVRRIIEQEEREQRDRQERQGIERFKKFRKISRQRNTEGDTLPEEERKEQLWEEKSSGSNGNAE